MSGGKQNLSISAFPCRSWLASEEVLENATRFKAAFAGKPAPTRDRVDWK
jgi:hypothetical protein